MDSDLSQWYLRVPICKDMSSLGPATRNIENPVEILPHERMVGV